MVEHGSLPLRLGDGGAGHQVVVLVELLRQHGGLQRGQEVGNCIGVDPGASVHAGDDTGGVGVPLSQPFGRTSFKIPGFLGLGDSAAFRVHNVTNGPQLCELPPRLGGVFGGQGSVLQKRVNLRGSEGGKRAESVGPKLGQ